MIARLRVVSAPLVVFGLLWAPSVSYACSQCLATRTRENQLAFIWTTVFLSITPLLIVGGIAVWLRRRLQAAEQAGETASEPLPPGISQPASLR